MRFTFLLGLALVLGGGLPGCSTAHPRANWPVFYDSEKGPAHLIISREPRPLNFW